MLHPKLKSGGFTLIELMIALAIGVVMIGALLSVLSSNQETYRIKQGMDTTQDAMRFIHFTIHRMAHTSGSDSGGAFLEPDNSNELVMRIRNPVHNQLFHVRDCLGIPVDHEEAYINRIYQVDNMLVCDNGRGEAGVISSSVESFSVRYGLKNTGTFIQNSDYVSYSDIDEEDWPRVSSIQVTVKGEGSAHQAVFTVTSRDQAIKGF